MTARQLSPTTAVGVAVIRRGDTDDGSQFRRTMSGDLQPVETIHSFWMTSALRGKSATILML
jgi:hypothetical protein